MLSTRRRAHLRLPEPESDRPPSASHGAVLSTEHLIDRMVRDVQYGRFERALSGLTAAAAVVTGAEIYLERYKASFGNKWMWSPVLLTPTLVAAGIGVCSPSAAPRPRCRSPRRCMS